MPGQLGIGVFSPLLDAQGNSVRGIRVCHEISKDFYLHLFDAPRLSSAVIRASYDAAQIRSRRLRNAEESIVLNNSGDCIKIYELQGELTFSTMEIVIREMLQHLKTMDFVIVDMKRVVTINEAAYTLFVDLTRNAAPKGLQFILTNVHQKMPFPQPVQEPSETAAPYLICADNDLALEWCENRLIAQQGRLATTDRDMALAEHDMCQGLTTSELHRLQEHLRPVSFAAGDLVIQRGDLPDNVYFLLKGEVSVTIGLPNGKVKRLSTLSAGMVFGELAVVDRLPRSADVRADTDVECCSLSCAKFDEFSNSDPKVRAVLLTNLLQHVSRMLRRANMEISVLAQ